MLCNGCGAINPTDAKFCWRCGKQGDFTRPPAAPQEAVPDAGMRMLIPVGRSGLAIAAGYLGLFSVLVIPAPFAVILGIMALNELKRKPELHGAGRAWFGIIMGVGVMLFFVIAIAANAFK